MFTLCSSTLDTDTMDHSPQRGQTSKVLVISKDDDIVKKLYDKITQHMAFIVFDIKYPKSFLLIKKLKF